MLKTVFWRRVLFLLILFILALGTVVSSLSLGASLPSASAKNSPYLQVTFLAVGQGDSIFIETPEGVQMLIDGGPDSSVLRSLGAVMSPFDREIDVVLATHDDQDHIGGLVDVLERYQVKHIIETNNEKETSTTEALALNIKTEPAGTYLGRVGQAINLGASTTFTVLSPPADTKNWESNTASIVGKLSFGEIDFFLTGDAPSGIEDYLVGRFGQMLESEVLKLGHHGSKTSTSENFLDTVKPEYAVVSAGKDNRYGHPHQEVVSRVEERGIKIKSTAMEGSITFLTDGVTVWQK